MDDFVRRVVDLSVSELDNEIQQYEELCLRYLEAYKECRDDDCRYNVRRHIQYYEECISVMRNIQALKLSDHH